MYIRTYTIYYIRMYNINANVLSTPYSTYDSVSQMRETLGWNSLIDRYKKLRNVTTKWNISTSANFCNTSVFAIEEIFTRQKVIIATYQLIHFYSHVRA